MIDLWKVLILLIFSDHEFTIFEADFFCFIILIESCENSVNCVDKKLSVIILERQNSSFNEFSIVKKLIDLNSLLFFHFMSL